MTLSNKYRSLQKQVSSKIEAWGSNVLLPALLILFVALSSGCDGSNNVGKIEKDRDGILRSIERYQEESLEIQRRIDKLAVESVAAAEVKEGIEKIMEKKSSDEEEIAEYEAEILIAMGLLEACQEAFKVKINLEPGAKFESISLKDGKELKDVVFKSFSPQSIKLSHSAGVGSYPIDLMPDIIAMHYVMPPAAPLSTIDPSAILARKPASLQTYAQIKQARGKASDARLAAKVLKDKDRKEKMEADRRAMLKEREAQEEQEMAKRGQAAVLRAELEKYERAYYELQRAYQDKMNSLDSSRIRKASADRQKVLSIYNTKGAELRNKIAEIQAKLAAVTATIN